MKFKSLLLDLDGTLIDTAPDMVGALNRLLHEHDQPSTDYALASQKVSNGASALVTHGFGNIDTQQREKLVARFLEIYQQYVCIESKIYAGLHDVLNLCEEQGYRWGVVTNKPLHLAKELMDGLGLLERCAVLLGGDSLPVKKPDPVPLLHSAMLLDLAPSECLYVGDHARDIQAGRAAGMDTGAALWGYIAPGDNVEEWQATYHIQQSTHLINLIRELVQNGKT